MALSDRPAERHRQVAGLFTERACGTRSWDAPSPVPEWTARDVVRHLSEQVVVLPVFYDVVGTMTGNRMVNVPLSHAQDQTTTWNAQEWDVQG